MNGTRRSRRRDRAGSAPAFVDSLRSAGGNATEAVEYLKTLLDVRTDQAGVGARRKATRIVGGLLAAIGAIALVLAASARFVSGLAGGLAELFANRPWAGDLATGVLLLGGLAVGVSAYLASERRKSFEKTKAKYERLHAEHRARFGRHVSDPDPADGRGVPGAGGSAGAAGSAG